MAFIGNWIPYRTTIPQGDILRPQVDEGRVIGQSVNFMSRLYALTTGYTQQNYNSSNTVTKQTNALTRKNELTKLTPPTLDFSSRPRANIK